MIRLEDRTVLAQDIEIAHRAGARLERACAEAGVTVRTLQRWKANDGLVAGDRRPGAHRPTPAHALSAEECQWLFNFPHPRQSKFPHPVGKRCRHESGRGRP